MFQEKDPKPVWSGCFTPEGLGMLGPLPDTLYCNSGAVCVWGTLGGGPQEGDQLTCCVLMLYKENVFMCYISF